MKEHLDPKSRKELENKILALLGEIIQPLPKEFQTLLADDLITAFENRFKVLKRAQPPMGFYIETAPEIKPQLIKA